METRSAQPTGPVIRAEPVHARLPRTGVSVCYSSFVVYPTAANRVQLKFSLPFMKNVLMERLVRNAGAVLFAVLTAAPLCASVPAAPTAAQSAMLARVFPAIVRIEAISLRPYDGHLTKSWTAGSGVIITPEGHVLTNCHVSEDVDTFRCYLYDGQHVDAHRVGQDPMTDIAVLQLDLSQLKKGSGPLPVAIFGDSDKMGPGDTVFALGSPGFLSQSVTRGIVSNPSMVLPEQTLGKMILRGEDVGMLVRWILHDASIFGGNSGGPLVNDRGEVVGVNEIGVFNLSGAIPGNLARGIAMQLIAHGHVSRGWSGLTVQPRLEADASDVGVVVSDVAAGSPAAKAGLLPGDIVLACDGVAIEGAQEKAVSHFYRLETGRLPMDAFKVDFLRDGKAKVAQFPLAVREPAQADDVELREWGAVVRDLTPAVVIEEQLPDKVGVLLENVRPGGPSGQSEPELRRGDVVIAVDGNPVSDVAGLRALTLRFFPDSETALTHQAIASIRRDGAVLDAAIDLRNTNPHHIAPSALKAWLGVVSQPLTPKLNKRLGINSEDGGARITRVYAGTEAEKAGLKVGDVLLDLDGSPIAERRAEDSEVLARQIRQYKIGTTATITLWREGKNMDLGVILEVQPKPAAEMPLWEDEKLEFEVRDLAFDDRARLQLDPGDKGALVSSTTAAGWAELAGLHAEDLVISAGGTPIASAEELHVARDEAVKAGKRWWVLQVNRRGQTLFVEINLKPAKA
jgi:serine protease Do